ncbi:MAG: hypothetical protein K9L75_01795 [Spirochaetia bacterium]|nr:hypothetical protein [Spirochaetia bacterium]
MDFTNIYRKQTLGNPQGYDVVLGIYCCGLKTSSGVRPFSVCYCSEPLYQESKSEFYNSIMLQNQEKLSGNTLTIEFSATPFEWHQHVLQWKDSRNAGTWNLYYSEVLQMEGWLCPVLLKYFDDAPKMLFLKIFQGT